MKKQLFYLLLAAGVLSACGPAAPQLGKDSVEDVIGAMTLEEKAHLVIGTGMVGTSGDSTVVGTTKKFPVQQVLLIRYPVWEFLPLCWLMDLQVYV